MLRGTTSQAGYRGPTGTTRTGRVHYSAAGAVRSVEVYLAVNAATHPELARRLLDAGPDGGLNAVVSADGARVPVTVPVVYHDPAARRFALVLPEAARSRELAERAALLAALAAETDHDVPGYVRDFAVVFGAAGLARWLDEEARRGSAAAADDERERQITARLDALAEREASLEARRAELERLAHELADLEQREAAADLQHTELARLAADLDRRAAELAARAGELDAIEAALAAREGELGSAQKRLAHDRDVLAAAVRTAARRPDSAPAPAPAAARRGARPDSAEPEEVDLTPLPRPVPHEEIVTSPFELLDAGDLKTPAARPVMPSRAPATADATRVGGARDVALERWIASRTPSLKVLEHGAVQLAALVVESALEGLLSDQLDVRVHLHRLPTYPLIVLTVGPAGGGAAEPLSFHFDVGDDADRAVLAALGREFAFELELFDTDYRPVSRRAIAADLGDNVRYVLSAADEHLAGLAPHDRSFDGALAAWSAADFDRHGARLPQRAAFRDELLDHLETPAQVRRAIALAAQFSEPSNEEYLLLRRGYSLARWRERRRQTLVRAVELGMWPGPVLAQIAVSESAARSRKDLVQRLSRAFARTAADRDSDLDGDAVAANWAALRAEAVGLGLSLERRGDSGPIAVSGTIGDDGRSAAEAAATGAGADDLWAPVERAPRAPLHQLAVPELIAQLDDKDRRRDVAIELCGRAEPSAIGPVFAALRRMTRGEAVRVLGHVVGFGEPATRHLIEGLRSRKAFLRHGCALALGVLKGEAGIEAICDLLVGEPTDIWREVARAIGEVGPGAVMSLVARLRDASDDTTERVAWALAHIAARGGRGPVETLSHGRDRTAAGVARKALEIAAVARTEDAAVRGGPAPRDQTVNRAFSRRFFEAMQRRTGDTGPLPRDLEELSDDLLVLEDADLLEEGPGDELGDDGELLDESDLIPT